MSAAMRREARELCIGMCRGRGPQAFAPTGLVAGLVKCRYCPLVKRAAHIPSEISRTALRGQPHERPQGTLDEPGAHQALLRTIGYERRSLEQLLAVLRAARVQVVVDVRWSAVSHIVGISEDRLQRAVLRADMDYLHLPSLGSPPSLRQRLERDGDYAAFFAAYRSYLAGSAQAQQTLRKASGVGERAPSLSALPGA